MKFLQLICIENETTDEQDEHMSRDVFPWVEDTIAGRINITGKPLDVPTSARTVRVRDGESLISDGPFADTKEFIGGFDLLSCETFDEAIGWAAKHPIARFHQIESAASSTSDVVNRGNGR
ncbi:MAG: YciI family protein [Solirubrobacteraceae bacterium]